MTSTHTLIQHREIQNWVTTHNGLPAVRRVPDRAGTVHARLTLAFGTSRATPVTTPTQDDGMSPVSWTAWLAELDRQRLALRVSGESETFEFVERRDLN